MFRHPLRISGTSWRLERGLIHPTNSTPTSIPSVVVLTFTLFLISHTPFCFRMPGLGNDHAAMDTSAAHLPLSLVFVSFFVLHLFVVSIVTATSCSGTLRRAYDWAEGSPRPGGCRSSHERVAPGYYLDAPGQWAVVIKTFGGPECFFLIPLRPQGSHSYPICGLARLYKNRHHQGSVTAYRTLGPTHNFQTRKEGRLWDPHRIDGRH